ncbi:PPOX class F420-dependent oxidoreductase [Actinacidiphila yeochonensis]|uniref:PPOX class F420-dependent oxidoreductase n=1 Tax=Actinacidiphila yeochonensis TaxID=89050 RepID=UPI000565583C|nr:PPOX class F420-dependent oxidoreductase [Actinacidiphila yeochonensis]
MSKPPLPADAVAMLAKPNPCVMSTLRSDGRPVTTATWYLWDDGRVLINLDEGRVRLKHLRNDPRVSLTVLDGDAWYTHISIVGHITGITEDSDLADIDRLSRQYTGKAYPVRDRKRYSAWIEVDRWHGWGAHKDNEQVG